MNYTIIIHSILRWAVLLFGFWAVVKAIGGITGKKNYGGSDNKAGLFFMIFCDIQLLVGLVLYFGNPWFEMLKTHTHDVMKNINGMSRFFSMEHALMMIIAWLLVHVGRSMVKRADTDAQKHKRSLIFFGIALLIIIAMIPWPFRAEIARPWIRFS